MMMAQPWGAIAGLILLLAASPAQAAERSGDLRGRDGHHAVGRVVVSVEGDRAVVRFPANFRVTNTNRVLVGMGSGGRLDRATVVTLLPALQGAQTVKLEPGTASPRYTELWLWCDQHQAEAGVARLR